MSLSPKWKQWELRPGSHGFVFNDQNLFVPHPSQSAGCFDYGQKNMGLCSTSRMSWGKWWYREYLSSKYWDISFKVKDIFVLPQLPARIPIKIHLLGMLPLLFLGFLPHQSNCPTVQRQRPSKPRPTNGPIQASFKTLLFFRFLPFFCSSCGMVLSTCRKKNRSPRFQLFRVRKKSLPNLSSAQPHWMGIYCGYLNQYLKGETCKPFGWAKQKWKAINNNQKTRGLFPDLSGLPSALACCEIFCESRFCCEAVH